ncbi:glutamate-rich protein 3-like isoform X2 [Palaemon carinicauda]|uniref:glutamate-rich protein 3-like isoform X2 n=1 Tax=Palaemon carinicauda TaxID=392227 RepID=UPI0035B58520
MWSKKPGANAVEGYNSLRDTHLSHYFSRQDVIRHLVHMGLVTRNGEIVPDTEWKKLYAKQERLEKEKEKENHRRRLLEAEEASKRRVKQKIRRREAQLGRQPSASEPDLIHFDIEWSFRPVSVTTEEAQQTSSGTRGTSNGTSDDVTGGRNNETSGPSDVLSSDTNESRGRQMRIGGFRDSSPEISPLWKKPNKYPAKSRFIGRRGMVGEPYVASLGPNPSPRYIHIIRPTNSCREVWSRLCPPQPIYSRPPRPPSPPHLRLVYARGGAPCHTPTDLALLQQPAGAHNVTVFHGIVQEGDEIEFTSLRRESFPFSLTIYEHGVTTGRLSACCEHRYAPGSRLGGPSGHLRVVEIVGGEPCLRCQLRSVEKRHQTRQRGNIMKPKDKGQSTRPYTPPEENESESGSQSGESTGSNSQRSGSNSTKSSQNSQASLKGSSDSMSSSEDSGSTESSTDIENDSQCTVKRKGDKDELTLSSDSCNGPSDHDVAAALGVTSGISDSSKKRRGRRKLSNAGRSGKGKQLTKEDQSIQRESSDDQRPRHISSSLEGQLDDSIKGRSKYHKKSKVAFRSRPGSARSQKTKRVKSKSRQSTVDSFYSQQTFTSSASENQSASGNVTEASYGSSWEEDEENVNKADVKEADESQVDEEVSDVSDSKEEKREEGMDTEEEENARTASSEVEEEVCSEKGTPRETEDEVESEVASQDSSKAETVKESDKSEENSITEDVGDESDIVGLSCSDEEIIEEKDDKDK